MSGNQTAATKQETYKTSHYICPQVYCNISNDKPGTVLLYHFTASQSRADAEDNRCDKISIALSKEALRSDEGVITRLTKGAPLNVMSLQEFSEKSNWYIAVRVLPSTFWQQPSSVRERMLEQYAASVLAEVVDRTLAVTDVFAVDLLCREYAAKEETGALKDTYVFQKYFQLDSIKVGSTSVKQQKKED